MSVTIGLELKTQPSSQGKFAIYVRITKDRKIKRIKSSVELDRKSDWNPKAKKIRSSNPDYVKLNDLLRKEVNDALAIYGEDMAVSIGTLKNKVKHKDDSSSLLEYSQEYADQLKNTGHSNAKHYQTLCNYLKSYLDEARKGDINFNEVTPAFVSQFCVYLQTQNNQRYIIESPDKRLHPNYIRTLLVKLRAILNEAIRNGKMKPDAYPFARSKSDTAKFKIPKSSETDREALDESDLEHIMTLDLEKGSMQWHTRNAFLFSFFCAGIRAGDLLTLRWDNVKGGILNYKMHKNGKDRILTIPDQAKAILDQYRSDELQSHFIFPFMDNNQQWAKYRGDLDTMPVDLKKQMYSNIYTQNTLINRALKLIALKAKVKEHLSFHISRHTFASLAVKKGVSTKIVQEMLGHSSLATTQTYLHSFGDNEVKEAMNVIFGSDEDDLLNALKKLSPDQRKNILNQLSKAK